MEDRLEENEKSASIQVIKEFSKEYKKLLLLQAIVAPFIYLASKIKIVFLLGRGDLVADFLGSLVGTYQSILVFLIAALVLFFILMIALLPFGVFYGFHPAFKEYEKPTLLVFLSGQLFGVLGFVIALSSFFSSNGNFLCYFAGFPLCLLACRCILKRNEVVDKGVRRKLYCLVILEFLLMFFVLLLFFTWMQLIVLVPDRTSELMLYLLLFLYLILLLVSINIVFLSFYYKNAQWLNIAKIGFVILPFLYVVLSFAFPAIAFNNLKLLGEANLSTYELLFTTIKIDERRFSENDLWQVRKESETQFIIHAIPVFRLNNYSILCRPDHEDALQKALKVSIGNDQRNNAFPESMYEKCLLVPNSEFILLRKLPKQS